MRRPRCFADESSELRPFGDLMSKPILQVANLCISLQASEIDFELVSNLDFEIDEGEILGMVGESGSGKTITALAIMGLLKPPLSQSGGRIRLQGQDLGVLDDDQLNRLRGSAMGMIFQEPLSALNPLISVGEQIREVLTAHRQVSRSEARNKALEMMELVGLPEVERTYRRYPHQLSGGMRQRVLIAGALICGPRLLIADEPTTALDVTIQAEILKLLRQMSQERQLAVLYITHDLAVVAELCDRVVTLYAGQQVEGGRVSQVLRNPLHPYTEGLLQSLPQLDPKAPVRAIPGSIPEPGAYPMGCRFHPRCSYVEEECRLHAQELKRFQGDRHVRCRRASELELTGLEF